MRDQPTRSVELKGRDNSAASDGRRCKTWWPAPTGGVYLCTRPALHDGPCVDRVHNTTRPTLKEQP